MGAMSLGWGIYVFTLNRRQKDTDDLKADIFRAITTAKEQQERALIETKLTLTNLQTEIVKMKEAFSASNTRNEVAMEFLKDTISKIEKNIERQEQRISHWGNVKVKD
jgi:methylthioribose-1-phosphate isomerase